MATICSAVIFDDIFRTVRTWIRQGYKPAAIQRELHARFSEVADLASQIARQHALHEKQAGKKKDESDSDGSADGAVDGRECGESGGTDAVDGGSDEDTYDGSEQESDDESAVPSEDRDAALSDSISRRIDPRGILTPTAKKTADSQNDTDKNCEK